MATGWLEPNLPMNKSKNIIVGNCDYGALDVMLNSPGEGNNKYVSKGYNKHNNRSLFRDHMLV